MLWLLLVLGWGAGLTIREVRAESPVVPMLADCRAVGAAARARAVPVMLVVSQDDCRYCERLRDEVIRPMILSGEYRGRVLIRELNRDASDAVRDFDGRWVAASTIADRYQATLTPTVLFLNSRGLQLARPIRGFNGSDFYTFYLDRAIAGATARLHE